MKISDVLSSYKRSDLNRLAKDKVANYIGLPIEILRGELSKVLTTYDYIKRNIQFRKPPGYTILDIIVRRQDYSVAIQGIKGIIQEEMKNIIKEVRRGEGLKEDKQYDLYAKMLKTAWDFQEDLLPPEANLLNALRDYLNITRVEHRLLEARLEVFKFSQTSFNREIEHYAREGIIFTHENNYIIPEEIVERIKEVWGIELDSEPYRRLLNYLTNSQLYSALGRLELTKSGSQEMRINRTLEKGVKPSDLLNTLTVSDLIMVVNKSKCPRKYKKDELIPTIISHIKRGEDIKSPPEEKPETLEPRLVTEEAFKEALYKFSNSQLYHVLKKKKLKIGGTKNQRVERIVNSIYSLTTILDTLRKDELINLSKLCELPPMGKKTEIIERIVHYFRNYQIKGTKATPKELFSIYEDLSKQNNNAYRDIGIDDKDISLSTMTADFERATKYIFESIFGLTVKTQTPGREEPDGVIKEDNIILYECKTSLSPPYELPIAHRDQFCRYMKDQYDKLEPHAKTALKCFILIAHSFGDKIEDKLAHMKIEPYIPFCLITASDLRFIAEKWLKEQRDRVLPTSKLIFQGLYTKDKLKANFI
ncbi:MAG: hypothetical protein R6T98_12115 [Desulfatiglandales bacterium]